MQSDFWRSTQSWMAEHVRNIDCGLSVTVHRLCLCECVMADKSCHFTSVSWISAWQNLSRYSAWIWQTDSHTINQHSSGHVSCLSRQIKPGLCCRGCIIHVWPNFEEYCHGWPNLTKTHQVVRLSAVDTGHCPVDTVGSAGSCPMGSLPCLQQLSVILMSSGICVTSIGRSIPDHYVAVCYVVTAAVICHLPSVGWLLENVINNHFLENLNLIYPFSYIFVHSKAAPMVFHWFNIDF